MDRLETSTPARVSSRHTNLYSSMDRLETKDFDNYMKSNRNLYSSMDRLETVFDNNSSFNQLIFIFQYG